MTSPPKKKKSQRDICALPESHAVGSGLSLAQASAARTWPSLILWLLQGFFGGRGESVAAIPSSPTVYSTCPYINSLCTRCCSLWDVLDSSASLVGFESICAYEDNGNFQGRCEVTGYPAFVKLSRGERELFPCLFELEVGWERSGRRQTCRKANVSWGGAQCKRGIFFPLRFELDSIPKVLEHMYLTEQPTTVEFRLLCLFFIMCSCLGLDLHL